ncbi:MerR family transcriptional regulator [Geobacter pickeringii]|uniref:MerR family transcriptional regulator n=1 Tax=Geobacter pickeringii TaxID=345632 RepID=A0A0B5BDC6_9BACT|nr:MerR family transcriptional regulator [Geobacter pickeringii]AJE04723.1 MerR family transcriptional regulator [Geobacter pickeringii]
MPTTEQTEELISIGDIAKKLGLTTRTLRYWEEVNIIEASPRSEGGNRFYTPYTVRRMRFILKLKELGLTIKEMQDLYVAYGNAKRTEIMIPRLIEILDVHINKVDEKMERLASLRKDIVDYRLKMIEKLHSSES